MKKIFETEVEVKEGYVEIEDRGRAKILEVDEKSGNEDSLFVRIHSYSDKENPEHPLFNSMIGKKIKVTVKVEK